MAFSQSIKRGQFPVNCQLCETNIKITTKCVDCDLLMCSMCKDRIHPKFKNARNHQILDIKDIGSQIAGQDVMELDFTNINCKEHSGHISCMFCKSCDHLVCPICISEIHNGHGLIQIKDGYRVQMEKLGTIENQVDEVLDELDNKEIKIKEIQKTEKSKYQDAKKRIQEQNVAIKKAIDQYTNNLLKELNQLWEVLENSTSEQKQTATQHLEVIKEKKSQIVNLRKSNDAEKIFSEVRSLSESVSTDHEPLQLIIESVPVFIPGEISQYNFGQLHQSPSTAINIDIIKTFPTNLGVISLISVNSDDSLWINNDLQRLVQKVKPDRDDLSIISSYNIKVLSMAITQSNDILLATNKMTLQMITHDEGLLKDTNYTVEPKYLIAVHVSHYNTVIVGAWDHTKRITVVVMDMEGKHEKIFEHDKYNEPLLPYPLQICSTRNSNIFVIDKLSDNFEGRVVILKHTGDIVNIYRGHPDINDDDTQFTPIRMACTPSDNILLLDQNTYNIYILNNNGLLIKYCDLTDKGILRPSSLAFSRSGKLFIGTTVAAGNKENNAKLYDVKIFEC